MPNEVVAKTEIIYKDVFEAKTLYIMMHDWLLEHEFTDEHGGDEYIERYYHQRFIQNVGREIRFWWRTYHYPAGSPYLRYKLYINFLAIAMKDVEIVKEGKKVKANHAEINVIIRGILETDYKRQMTSGFWAALMDRFNRYFYKHRMWYHREFLLGRVQQLEQEIKTHLSLKHFLRDKEPFAPRFKGNG